MNILPQNNPFVKYFFQKNNFFLQKLLYSVFARLFHKKQAPLSSNACSFLYRVNRNNRENTADTAADKVYDNLISPVNLLAVFVRERENCKPNAAEERAHTVHTEARAVQGKREEHYCGEADNSDYNRILGNLYCLENKEQEQKCCKNFLYKIQRHIFLNGLSRENTAFRSVARSLERVPEENHTKNFRCARRQELH